MKKIAFVLTLLLFFLSCKNKKDIKVNAKLNHKIEKEDTIYDIAYGSSPRQKLNAYLPANRTKKTKAILLIPGGGWKEGDKKNFDHLAGIFSDSSIVAFTMNYRFISDQNTYVDLLDDIDKAIQFIASKSEEYVFNSDKISLLGHSAGAHLALLYSYRNNKANKVKNVISVAAPTDFTDTTFVNLQWERDLLSILTGSKNEQEWKDASPIYHSNKVTTYLYHGKLDTLVPYQQSEKLFNKIKNNNSKNRYSLFEDGTHTIKYTDWMQIVSETIALINEH